MKKTMCMLLALLMLSLPLTAFTAFAQEAAAYPASWLPGPLKMSGTGV